MPASRQDGDERPKNVRTILGLRFFLGTAAEAVARTEGGGLVLIPAAPALKDIATNHIYRDALLSADTLLTDSAFMVLIWNALERDHITRLSGLAYLRELLRLPSFQAEGNTLWILPRTESVARTSEWLSTLSINVPSTHFYVAPMYEIASGKVVDPALIALIERLKPQHVVLGVGGGTQEPLGADLKHRLSYLPAIHCVGAAIGFLTGEQAAIPVLADHFYLGWLLRTIHNPARFSRRYWEARKLLSLLRRYRDRSPVSLPMVPRSMVHPAVAEDTRRA
jgi:N-acetylglucosaminyldiphosphoundecaprenol N-acetyl-beta-D-mannosaminyltransferase